MNKIKIGFVMLSLALFTQSAIAADSVMTADKAAVNSACTAESTTAGCGSEQVGTGLLKCIHAYKKANKGFKVSDGCKTAMKQMHADKKARK
jgi:hypothetical protein